MEKILLVVIVGQPVKSGVRDWGLGEISRKIFE